MGITRPTTLLSQPSFSILAIMRGRADSEDEVPSTISSSSRMYLMNFRMLKPWARAMPPSTTSTNSRQVM
ncbi:hypothetical protein D3C76_1753750 [compost metagenome]